jgi:hypothetical protein
LATPRYEKLVNVYLRAALQTPDCGTGRTNRRRRTMATKFLHGKLFGATAAG